MNKAHTWSQTYYHAEHTQCGADKSVKHFLKHRIRNRLLNNSIHSNFPWHQCNNVELKWACIKLDEQQVKKHIARRNDGHCAAQRRPPQAKRKSCREPDRRCCVCCGPRLNISFQFQRISCTFVTTMIGCITVDSRSRKYLVDGRVHGASDW